jgi:hypothetical protein
MLDKVQVMKNFQTSDQAQAEGPPSLKSDCSESKNRRTQQKDQNFIKRNICNVSKQNQRSSVSRTSLFKSTLSRNQTHASIGLGGNSEFSDKGKNLSREKMTALEDAKSFNNYTMLRDFRHQSKSRSYISQSSLMPFKQSLSSSQAHQNQTANEKSNFDKSQIDKSTNSIVSMQRSVTPLPPAETGNMDKSTTSLSTPGAISNPFSQYSTANLFQKKKKSVQLGYSTKQVQDPQTHQSSSLVRKSQELTSDVKPKSLYSKHKGVSTYVEKSVTYQEPQQQQQATTNSYQPD